MQIRRSLALAALFALVITVATVPRARKLDSPDFKVFYVAARHVLTEPANLYKISPDRYLYPPSAAILLTPFAFTENFAVHQWLWHGLLGLIVFALAGAGGASLAAMALLSRYLAVSLGYGQINLVVMGLLALAGIWVARRPRRAGAVWALAVSLKVYPAAFAPAFFPKQSRRGTLAGAGVGLAILLLPFLVFGPALALQLYGEFFIALESKGMPLHSHNQSITALLLRLFTDQSFHLHSVGDTQWTLLALPQAAVVALSWLIGAGLTVATWLRAKERLSGEAFLSAAAFSIIFLSHIVWKDYLLFLFFPLAEVFRRYPRRQAMMIAVAFLLPITLSSPDIIGFKAATRLDAACIHLWAAILVWIAWWRK
jgi:hypothetical protein